ncbi:MAG: 4-hydroxy-tetrahydrodipicolinate reductase [Elusimicrobia bacterium]|nr:4-hydroxy-tetrahydrodipicolinate reductase [Elusimicrobiota bacterium]MDE2236843.1 4-hydroxy-tetrahydrodipicolinate reductase [Elusimicrobiota bacterium]MDE2425817.1 4-hydroxy-tetrahydrodipicolinate reductase [Elusimicrobiota bacterium]
MAKTRLVLCGARGRMGSCVAKLSRGDSRFELVAGIERGSSARTLASALAKADVAVDFSTPQASLRLLEAAAAIGRPVVIGTTGFSREQSRRLRRAAAGTAVFLAPNFSRGVALLRRLAEQAARLLPDFEAGIFELHHCAKRDAPSGTALALRRAVALGRSDGAQVPIVSQRLGGAVGEHTLTLAGAFERLELTHRAQSRAAFARGALEAALWIRERKPGLYGMDDLLGVPPR